MKALTKEGRQNLESKAKTLHIFNPEHDLALAVGQGPYTPPAEVLKIRKKFTLLPALYADDSDFILSFHSFSSEELSQLPFYSSFLEKNMFLIGLQELINFNGNIDKVDPWGWDHALRNILLENGLAEENLMSIPRLDRIRQLSHRRNVSNFRKELVAIANVSSKNMPEELYSEDEIEEFLKHCPLAYFKAPWSSSGRGIIVSDHISPKGLREWCHGVIRRQGSVIAEPSWNRVFDFASEWMVSNGEPVFLGMSVFETSSRGKYHKNIQGSQKELFQLIKSKIPEFSLNLIEAQQEVIKKIISPFYEGCLGIDMLADSLGEINPCVELNLRRTMGHVALAQENNHNL